jgi:hypothetical protein
MSIESRHLQLRLSPQMRKEIKTLADKFELSASDVIRGAMLFGLPVFEAMNELQDDMVKRLALILKHDASLRPRK